MTDESPTTDPRSLWRGQASKSPLTLETVQRRGEKMRRSAARVSVVMTAACVGLTVPFAFILGNTHTFLERFSMLLMFVGIGYLLSQVHRPWIEMRTESAGPLNPNSTSIEYYRSELARLRDFSSGRVFWSRYLMFIPGYVLYFTARTIAHPNAVQMKWVLIGALLISLAAIPLNLFGARGAQRKLDEVDRLLQENT
jgi:hypothetical protein